MEENEELAVAAAEITAREEIKRRMLERLEASLKKGEDGSYIFEGTGIDDFYDFRVFIDSDKLQDRDIRLSMGGETYTADRIRAEFEKIEAKISETYKDALPNRTRLETDLLSAQTEKAGLDLTSGELDKEFSDLQERCQEAGRVLPSDAKEQETDENTK